jgi:hypothetical protein
MSVAAREIRRLHRLHAQTEQRLARAKLRGAVAEVDDAKRLCRVEIGKTADGKSVLSPWVSWREPGNGFFARHTPMKVGDLVSLESKSGTIGAGSIAVRDGYSGEKPAPSNTGDAVVDKIGGLTITYRDGAVEYASGGVTWGFSAAGQKQTGGSIEHDGHAIDKSHVHTGVIPGGGNSGPPP